MNVFHRICLVLGAIACISTTLIQSSPRRRRGADLEASIYSLSRLAPNEDIIDLLTTSIWFPQRGHSNLRCGNFGNASIRCNCNWGTGEGAWHGHIATALVEPNTTRTVLCASENPLYASSLKVYNPNGHLGLIWGERGEHPTGPRADGSEDDSFDYNEDDIGLSVHVENLFRLAVDTLVATDILVDIFQDIFFPAEKEKDPWEEVKDKVLKQLDAAKTEIIILMIKNEVKPIRYKIKDIQNNMDDPDIRRIYLNLADTLDGYDTKFTFDHFSKYENARINTATLSIYARVVNMQLNYYYIGINSQEKLGLKDSDIKRLKRYMKVIVPRAIEHVETTLRDRIEGILNDGDLEEFYDTMMTARTAAELCGRAYYYDWYKIALPEELPEMENRTGLAYSEAYGFASINLYQQAFSEFGAPPLTPRMTGPITRSQWISFRLWYCWGYNPCGFELWFDNDDYHSLGSLWDNPQDKQEINENRRVVSLTVSETLRGIRSFQFVFSGPEKEELKYGYAMDSNPHTFKKKNYYIASMFVANDVQRMGQIIVNTAVSYQMDPEVYQKNGTMTKRVRDLIDEKTENST